MNRKNMINIYADGGCRNNKRGIENIGAWAYRIEMEDSVTEYSEPLREINRLLSKQNKSIIMILNQFIFKKV